jgi:hypothetical protein
MTIPVPTGAWQREWISRHGGPHDATVTVRYIQTPSAFGDVRIRADRPDLASAASFADLSDEQLLALANQKGFAGYTTVDGENATWHHEIDYQPTDNSPDIGRIELAAEGKMFEHALDASYIEAWSTIGRDDGRFLAVRVSRGGRVEHLLSVAGDHFVYARARATPLPAADSIADAITKSHATRNTIIAFLDCELSYGTTRAWQVWSSTLPWREGKRLPFADRIALDASGQPSARTPEPGESWSVPVNTLAPAELHRLFAVAR